MTFSEYFNKYGIKFHIDSDGKPGRATYSRVLDHMYLSFTKEQALKMVAEYYDHADEIFNSIPNYLDE
jgi:hypothetical protein